MISSSQIRAARALLNWNGQQLADASGISLKTLRRYESHEGIPSATIKSLTAIKVVLEAKGIEFIGDPLVNPGVVLNVAQRG